MRYPELTTVIYAPAPVIEEVNRLRALLPPSGVPVMDAHVTVRGRIYDLTPEEALPVLRRACAKTTPFTLRCLGLHAWYSGLEQVSLTVPVWQHPALRRLHTSLHDALGDISGPPPPHDDPAWFMPHLTLVQQFPAAQLVEAVARLERTPGWSFTATEVALMQRAPDGWRECGRAPLAGG